MMDRFTSMSLKRPWQELSEEYIQNVEDIVYFRGDYFPQPSEGLCVECQTYTLIHFTPPWAFEIFTAFKRHEFVRDLVREYRNAMIV